MSRAAEEVLEAALALPEDERVEVVARLQESVSGSVESVLSPEWKQEIARRIQELEEGTVESIPAEEVDRQMLEKYGFLAD